MTLLKNFHAAHGAKGFVSQGVFPEMLRATYMRVSKCFLFPIAHRAVFNSNPSQGTPLTKAFAGAIVTLPEGAALSPPSLLQLPLLRYALTVVMLCVTKLRALWMRAKPLVRTLVVAVVVTAPLASPVFHPLATVVVVLCRRDHRADRDGKDRSAAGLEECVQEQHGQFHPHHHRHQGL